MVIREHWKYSEEYVIIANEAREPEEREVEIWKYGEDIKKLSAFSSSHSTVGCYTEHAWFWLKSKQN